MFEVVPAPLSVAVIMPVVLLCAPVVIPVTVTSISQWSLAASIPPVKVSRLLPVITRLPPQTEVFPLATVIPSGRVSVKAIPVRPSPALGFATAKLMVVVLFRAMLADAKDLVIVGAAAE